MAEQFTGILPFDADDSSIILKCSLRTAASVAAPAVGPAGTITGVSHTFDPQYGFRPADSGNSGILFSNATGFAALDNAGQLSYEISKRVATALQASQQSDGTSPAGVQWQLVWGNGSNTGSIRKVSGSPSNLQLRTHNTGDTAGVLYIHSDDKPDMVRITYSWIGSKVMMFIDGKPVGTFSTTPTRNTRWSNQFQNIAVMAASGGVNPERDGYMRDLIISSRPVMLPVHQQKRVVFLGHSFSVTYSDLAVNVNNYDVTVATELRKRALQRGYDLETRAFGVGGGYWDPALSTSDIRDYVATALAAMPNILVCYGPVNDVASASFNATTVDTEIKTDLTTVGNHAAMRSLDQILFVNVPSRAGGSADGSFSEATRNNIVAANTNIDALPSWWNSTFPAYSGRLRAVDLFNAWGGMNPASNVMVGQRSGSLNNLHPSCLGIRIIAEEIARQIF